MPLTGQPRRPLAGHSRYRLRRRRPPTCQTQQDKVGRGMEVHPYIMVDTKLAVAFENKHKHATSMPVAVIAYAIPYTACLSLM